MKIRSRSTPLLQLLLPLVIIGVLTGQPTPPKTKRPAEEQQKCLIPVLRSYLFKGRPTSTSNFKSLLCPSLTKTCCNRFDEQRAFHLVNDILPSRLLEYREKIKSAIVRVKLLRANIIKRKPNFRGSQSRQEYCFREFRRLDGFTWNTFHDRLVNELEHTYQNFDDHYSAFFCILCDANNHKNFVFRPSNQGIMVDTKFCNDFLENHIDLFKLWNIEFMNLMVNIQNVVDCFHYRNSFNMPFFDKGKRTQLDNSGKCVGAIGSRTFLVNCKPICDKIRFAGIVDLVEGDFEFMTIATNLLERYLRVQEVGQTVNRRLRSFFKTLTKQDPKHPEPLGQLDVNFDSFKVGHDFDPGMGIDSNRDVIRDANLTFKVKKRKVKKVDPHRYFDQNRKLVQTRARRSSGYGSRPSKQNRLSRSSGLKHSRDRYLTDSGTAQSIRTQVEANLSPSQGTLVPAFNPLHKRQLSAVPPAPIQASPRSSKAKAGPAEPKKVKPIPLVYSRELRNKYKMLAVPVRPDSTPGVYEIEQKPMDFDKASRYYDMDNGINVFRYQLAFKQSERAFYLNLFSYRKPEKMSVEVVNFLSDFTPQFRVEAAGCLKENFKVEGRYWVNPVGDPNKRNYVESLYRK